MKHLTGIDSLSPMLRPAEVPSEPLGADDPASHPRPTSDAAQQEYQPAIDDLQTALEQAGGSPREASLRFKDDGSYVVEIRAKDDGRLLQEFPAENLLNCHASPADLLGTVIDRRS